MSEAWAELNERETNICLFFNYDRDMVDAAKEINGRKFVAAQDSEFEGIPYWRLPLDIRTARTMREKFPKVQLGKKLKAWGYRAAAQEAKLGSLSIADTAELVNLPSLAPDMHKFVSGRPYQLADIAFMAACDNPLNANAPGLGKTIEIIASVFESLTHDGPQLVLAPVTSLEVVWEAELLHEEHGQDLPVLIAQGDRAQRELVLRTAWEMAEAKEPFWLLCNPQMAQVKKDEAASKKKGKEVFTPVYPQLFDIEWNNIIVDEFHQCGMGNVKTVTRKGLTRLEGHRRIASSGTPVGGKTQKLWGVLNWLEPERYTSKWRWFDHWLLIDRNEVHVGSGEMKKVAKVGEIKPGMADQFYKEHAGIMVRRTKAEVRKDLPEKNRINRWCEMGTEQKKQYKSFELKAELQIEEENMNAIGILALYTRLRQFAIAKQELKRNMKTGDSIPYPTNISCKMDQLYSILADHGLTASKDEDEQGTEQVIIFSQFTKVCEMVARELNSKGITANTLTGSTSTAQRKILVDDFEARRGASVLIMQTKTGGVAITLNQSEAIIFMDETWTPDEQDQAEDRNRNNSADIYYIRTRGTIEEYVLSLNVDKRNVNDLVLDVHRKRMASLREGAAAVA